MNTRQAAKYLGISYYYLRNMRHLLYAYDGPEYTMVEGKHGPTACYTKPALDLWADTHKWRKDRRYDSSTNTSANNPNGMVHRNSGIDL